MSNHASCGTLVICVELDGPADGDHSLRKDAALASIDALLSSLRDARMPATWASQKPSMCEAVTAALGESIGHEIALAGNSHQAGTPTALRPLRELAREIEQAQRAGYRITTLTAHETPSAEQLQSLCRIGITAIARTQAQATQSSLARWLGPIGLLMGRKQDAPPQPCLLRYGLWEVTTAMELPAHRGIGSRGALQRAVRAAANCGDVLQVTIRASRLQASRAGGMKQVEAILHAAFELRRERQLAIRTVADAVGRLPNRRGGRPARSILRRAA